MVTSTGTGPVTPVGRVNVPASVYPRGVSMDTCSAVYGASAGASYDTGFAIGGGTGPALRTARRFCAGTRTSLGTPSAHTMCSDMPARVMVVVSPARLKVASIT